MGIQLLFNMCIKFVALIGTHTIVDWISLKFDTSQLSHNMYHNHLMMKYFLVFVGN